MCKVTSSACFCWYETTISVDFDFSLVHCFSFSVLVPVVFFSDWAEKDAPPELKFDEVASVDSSGLASILDVLLWSLLCWISIFELDDVVALVFDWLDLFDWRFVKVL